MTTDALDRPRGPMPDEGYDAEPPDPWWTDRVRRILGAAAKTEREAMAWRAPSHVAAGRAIGRSRDRARQIRRQVAWIIVTQIVDAMDRSTPTDRWACGWADPAATPWHSAEWHAQRHRIDLAVASYHAEVTARC